ncbi:probable ATP-dependent RNA helicase DDX5 [Ornithodoros turicata]|uniref:probable ATP-dependent RNA helicase DDX5 n=1 Tax=Ornithodoros turicata TaxID=34597 RepID=UPI003138785C
MFVIPCSKATMWTKALRRWTGTLVQGRGHFSGPQRRKRESGYFDAETLGQRLVKPRFDRLEPIEKNLYIESELTRSRSHVEIEQFLAEQQITLNGYTVDVPKPVLTIDECVFLEKARHLFAKKNFVSPSPIQAQAWPIVLSGRDLVGIAQTGSGKTLAYALPGAIHASHQRRSNASEGPIAVVLAPTRELVQQIHGVIREWCEQSYNVRAVPVYGGASRNVQIAALQRGPQVCIATPGRLLDLLESGSVSLFRCTFLVMDEADRMLDMGFEPQIRKIVEQTRPDRQTVMWSATWPEEVRTLALDFLTDFIQVNIGSVELCANHNIRQVVEVCSYMEKDEKLVDILKDIGREEKTLIFASTKRGVARLVHMLYDQGFRAVATHGDLSQSKRDLALDRFRSGRTNILVATDVASRGLDVSDIKYVINYDYPGTSEDYVHRIGRTGRSNRTGTAITLFTYEDANRARDLVQVLREADQEVNPELHKMMDLHKKVQQRSFNPRYRGRSLG